MNQPDLKSKYYIKTTYGGYNRCILIDPKTGSVLPNCVGYAFGRFMQLGSVTSCKLPICNAEDWWANSGAYEHGQEPRVGAVMCWRKGKTGTGSDGAGHVCIVEEVFPDGSVRTSESNYGGAIWFSKIRKKPYPIAGQSFQGFIYNPFVQNKKPIDEIARDVIAGKYGNGMIRRARLEAAGYDAAAVQQAVNRIMRGEDLEKIARDVIAGKYGNGQTRKIRLEAAGFNYLEVQRKVNELLNKR